MEKTKAGWKELEKMLKKSFGEIGASLYWIDNTRDEIIERELGIKRELGESAGYRSGHIPLPTAREEKIRRNIEVALTYNG